MKISVVTAGWRPDGVKNVIKSLDEQTFQNWEHLIINDNNPELRTTLAGLCLDPRRHWIDLGVRTHYYGGFSRNVGAMLSFGYLKDRYREFNNEWICFLDDDNFWEANHLQLLADEALAYPGATMIGTDLLFIGVKNPDYRHRLKCRLQPQQCDIGSFMIKKELFDKYGYFRPRPRRKITFDWELLEIIGRGEAEDWKLVEIGGSDNKIRIIHSDNPTFHFYHKER